MGSPVVTNSVKGSQILAVERGPGSSNAGSPQQCRCFARGVAHLGRSWRVVAMLFVVFVELCNAHRIVDDGPQSCADASCATHRHLPERGIAHLTAEEGQPTAEEGQPTAGETGRSTSLAAQMDGETLLSYNGPVEAVWIEESSTLLDGENELCLVSGELITVEPTVRRFYIHDLTVSGGGAPRLELSDVLDEDHLTASLPHRREQFIELEVGRQRVENVASHRAGRRLKGDISHDERSNRSATWRRELNGEPRVPNVRALSQTGVSQLLAASRSSAEYKRKSAELRQLAEELFTRFNHEVFDNRLPPLGSAAMALQWNPKLLKSAGRCALIREPRMLQLLPPKRKARIELSAKILDSHERVAQTLAHEMCHAAQWLIDGETKPPHSQIFWKWAALFQERIPSMRITRCHSYKIYYKYQWICGGCGAWFGRHTKSIATEEVVCGRCKSKLTYQGAFDRDGNEIKLSGFAKFVQESYAGLKAAKPRWKQARLMEEIAKQWKEVKRAEKEQQLAQGAGATAGATWQGGLEAKDQHGTECSTLPTALNLSFLVSPPETPPGEIPEGGGLALEGAADLRLHDDDDVSLGVDDDFWRERWISTIETTTASEEVKEEVKEEDAQVDDMSTDDDDMSAIDDMSVWGDDYHFHDDEYSQDDEYNYQKDLGDNSTGSESEQGVQAVHYFAALECAGVSESRSYETLSKVGSGWDKWLALWQKRLDRWWLGMPLSSQQQVGGCLSALGLHLASRLNSQFRLWHLGGALGVSARPPPPPPVESLATGCEWIGEMEGAATRFKLPDFPDFPHLFKDMPPVVPIPRLMPDWNHLQSLHSEQLRHQPAKDGRLLLHSSWLLTTGGIATGAVAGGICAVGALIRTKSARTARGGAWSSSSAAAAAGTSASSMSV